MPDAIALFLDQTWVLLNEAAPWVLLGFAVAALLKAFVPDAFIARHLGGQGIGPVLRASLIGVPLPLCSCGVVPAALGLRRQGAGRGATTAFLVSTPETGVDSVAVTWALLDPVMTVARPVAAFITATLAGLAVDLLPAPKPAPAPRALPLVAAPATGCTGGACCAPRAPARAGLGPRLRAGFGHAFGDMLADIGLWLLGGIAVAGAIAAFVPQDALAGAFGHEGWAMLLMLAAGIPLYICATASTPIAASLALKGLSPGAALVFLLAGPATNAATIAVVAREMGRAVAGVYVAAIAAAALLLGWCVNRLYALLGLDIASWIARAEVEQTTWFSTLCAVALLALVARAAWAARRHTTHGEDCAAH